MKLTKVETQTLAQLGGGLSPRIDAAIGACVADVLERRHLANKRTVRIELDIRPIEESDDVDVVLNLSTKMPKLSSAPRRCKARKTRDSAGLLFDLDEELPAAE